MPTIMDSMIAELEAESPKTRKLLERMPPDKGGWKPHPRAMSLGQLAVHIASLPGGIAKIVASGEWNTTDLPPQPPQFTSHAQVMETFEKSLAEAVPTLRGITDAAAAETFRIIRSEQVLLEMPRAAAMRFVLFNHLYHHRGQLSTYLRILDVKLPSIYGPSADESPFTN